MSNVAYSAIVLDERSREKLINFLNKKNLIPEGWEIIVDHATINSGEIDPNFIKYLGFPIKLNVIDYAIDDKVMAVGVSGFQFKNAKPHITVAVNRVNGGKPVMSNNLTDWKNLGQPLTVVGKVSEVKYNL
jgi:hypothetical protein